MPIAKTTPSRLRASSQSLDGVPFGAHSRSEGWNHASLFRFIARGACIAGVLQATSVITGIVLTAVLARALGSLEFGVYALSMSQAQLLAAAVGWGIPLTVVRFLPQYLANNQLGHARGAFRALATATYTSSGLLLALGSAVLLLGFQGAPVDRVGALVTLLLAGLGCAGNFQTELARANRRLMLAYFPMGAAWPMLMIGACGALLLREDRVTAQSVLITSAVLLLVILLAQVGVLHRLLAGILGSARPVYEPREWRQVAVPLWVVTFGSMILATSDVLLLGLMTGKAEAAKYFIAKRLSALVGFSLVASNAIVAPLISEFFHANRRRALESTLANAALFVFVPALVSAVALMGAGHVALRWFGEEYTSAWPELYILVLGQLVNASAGAVGYLMNLTGQQLASMMVFAAAAILQISLAFLLVPQYGAVGAAIANAVSMSAWNICLVLYVRLRLGLDPTIFCATRRMRLMKGISS